MFLYRCTKAKPPAATREQLVSCWSALSVDKRAEVLDLAVGGEAGVLVLTAFSSRPKSAAVLRRALQDSASSSSEQMAQADYAKAGGTLRDAVDKPQANAASLQPSELLDAIEKASEVGLYTLNADDP